MKPEGARFLHVGSGPARIGDDRVENTRRVVRSMSWSRPRKICDTLWERFRKPRGESTMSWRCFCAMTASGVLAEHGKRKRVDDALRSLLIELWVGNGHTGLLIQ